MATIDGLFEQIIHSEKAALKRKSQLQELRQSVFAAQEEVKRLQREGIQLKKQLNKKVYELGEKELTVKWLTSQEQILKEQKAELQKEIKDLEDKQDDITHQIEVDQTQFCEDLSEFCSKYGITGDGREQRDKEYEKQLKLAQEEEQQLQLALKAIVVKQQTLEQLERDEEDVKSRLEKAESLNSDLSRNMCDVLQKNSDLETQQKKLSNISGYDLEFKSLQSTLENDRQHYSVLDHEFSRLQEQLNDLHRQLWQKQTKQRQQQQKQQQQQQKQQQQMPDFALEAPQDEFSEEHLKEIFSESEDFGDEEWTSPSDGGKPNTKRRHIFKPKS